MKEETPRRIARVVLLMLVMSVTTFGVLLAGIGPGSADTVDGVYFLTGEADDQANKAAMEPSATFSKDAPTSEDSIQQEMTNRCNAHFVQNFLCAFWTGEYTGSLSGPVEFCFYMSSTNAAVIAGGTLPLNVVVFGDPDLAAGGVQDDKVIGEATVDVPIGIEPTSGAVTVEVNGQVAETLVVQIFPGTGQPPAAPDGDVRGQGHIVNYGSTAAPSAFGPVGKTCPEGASPSESTTGPPGGGDSHKRSITLDLKDRGSKLKASGKVTVKDRFNVCRDNVPVKIQRLKGKRYETLEKTVTNGTGRYDVEVPDKEDRYRAVANKTERGGGTCKRAARKENHGH